MLMIVTPQTSHLLRIRLKLNTALLSTFRVFVRDILWGHSSTVFHDRLAPLAGSLSPLKWPDIAKSHSVLSTSVLVVFPGGSGSLDLDELG